MSRYHEEYIVIKAQGGSAMGNVRPAGSERKGPRRSRRVGRLQTDEVTGRSTMRDTPGWRPPNPILLLSTCGRNAAFLSIHCVRDFCHSLNIDPVLGHSAALLVHTNDSLL